ncbi:uncharacterized protein LOC108914273 [Anoplophora glabripennis]|nr:uncharacterized protein LOC108914273 [Anoplophora glabripennis]
MKRKRKIGCSSPLLDDSPKRTKVHAQRKFAQGSNVNSPVITPIKELESEIPKIDVLPEPVELLPIKRPNTEDFLTFLCFRGTPILPPTLNFFNTASIVDTNGQVHEIKGESPKNGPIDIAKCGTSSEKPFIAFGVRKRADPIVISRQMDRKRRHALALQALRRKYQEQKMAKIRALTISKLSEKVTNKTLVRTNTVSKTETVTKKTNTLQKTKVVATKHVKVTTQTLKTTLRPKIKPKMCLRSFRGRFVQKELPFRKRVVTNKKIIKKPLVPKMETKDKDEEESDSEDEEPLASPVKESKPKPLATKVIKKTVPVVETSPRITRSGPTNKKIHVRIKQIKKRILISAPTTIVKPRSLRSTTVKKTILSQRKSKSLKAKQKLKAQQRVQSYLTNKSKLIGERNEVLEIKKPLTITKKDTKLQNIKKDTPKISDQKKETCKSSDIKKFIDIKKSTDFKKDARIVEQDKTTDIKTEVIKSTDIKKEVNKTTDVKKINTKLIEKKETISKSINREITKSTDVKKEIKIVEVPVGKPPEMKKDLKICVEKNKKEMVKMSENVKKTKNILDHKEPSSNFCQGKRIRKDDENIKSETNVISEKSQKNKSVSPENKKPCINVQSDKNKKSLVEGIKNDGIGLEKPKRNLKNIAIENKKPLLESPSEDSDQKGIDGDVKNESLASEKCKRINKSKFVENKKQSPSSVSDKPIVKKEIDTNIKEVCNTLEKSKRSSRNISLENKKVNINSPVDKILKSDTDIGEKEKTGNLEKSKKNCKAIDKSAQGNSKKLPCIKKEMPETSTKKEVVVKRELSKVNEISKKDNKIDIRDNNIKTGTTKSCTAKCKKDASKKDEDVLKEENVKKNNDKLEDVSCVLPKTQRPSRKTKEAAAIYMEILSHKLVNDSKIDDDNISIDSFPELPNVKRTEQRENELKAQAKYTKDDIKIRSKVNENEIEIEIKDVSVQVEDAKLTSTTKQLTIFSEVKKSNCAKKKTGNEINLLLEVNPTDEVKKVKLNKTSIIPKKSPDLNNEMDSAIENIATEKPTSKRQTRNSCQGNKKESDDSDESFHIDIKIPRVKKLTRSKTIKVLKTEDGGEIINISTKLMTIPSKVFPKNKKECSSSDSDQSTTSDINLQTLMNRAKNKKFSKTKSMKKTETAFSDSDEEPLSKLTNRSVESSQNSSIPDEKLREKSLQDLKVKELPKSNSKYRSSSKTNQPASLEIEQENVKPKRECAKRPQNYLPMLSSSDEDDIFHGFDEKIEDKIINPVTSIEPHCSHTPPFLDLLSKDIGRRYGKEKVNMSNEQIEKWLKDSALAGSSIKKENDEMLKFGERIPTETTLDGGDHIDTQKLKTSLLEVQELKKESSEKIMEDVIDVPLKSVKVESTLIAQIKPQAIDRKLIFRKSKRDTIPNVNAFSPENESSVYAFGEENEDVISTPFRRPSRRPSSTATSRSEDESSKHDDSLKIGPFRKPSLKQDVLKYNKEESDANIDTDESSHHFYIPQKPTKHNSSKLQSGSNFSNKLKNENKSLVKPGKSTDKISELDDFKYKIPSSPSASSSSSAKLYKRQTQKPKIRPPEFMNPIYVSDFPKKTDAAKLVEAPVFHPTDQEFQDPLEYIERIRHKAEQFGICRIVPPSTFKPECKVLDDMRFTAYNQYVHKMLYRWGPNFKELMAIKKYLETQNISLTHPPWIGGMEIDLPRLYQTVQTLGGLKEVIEKKKWPRVSELMKIPKSAQDRVTKLDDIYCKYLLPYDTLSPAEREKLFDEVETEWAKRESKTLLKVQQKLIGEEAATDGDSDADDNEVEECITKGRNMALNAFYRIARNTMSMYFKTPEPSAQDVEQEYWKHVTLRQNHICVHSGSIDSGSWGYGFAVSKNSPFARHPWNLKVLTNNNGSVLRCLGPIMGVTVPTLHVGMVFSACCWYRDPHGLPWIEYLHTGGSKIWYAIPNSTSEMFHSALKNLVPNYCKNKELWLPSDTVMVPPSLLVENNVSLCRTVQDPGQFIVVFPKAFTSCISTGYVVSESVYFAPPYWLKTARGLFDSLRNSKEPSMFSLDRLILNIASDGRCNTEILRQIIPHLQALCDNEKEKRLKLSNFGTMESERMPLPEAGNRRKKKLQGEEGDYECEVCRTNLFVSMVFDTQDAVTYCLDHALEAIENKTSQISNCKFMFTYDDKEIESLPTKIKMTIENKLQKKVPNKYAGMPTLLK